MSGRVAKAIRRQMGTTGVDPASRLWKNQYRYMKRLYYNPNRAAGGRNYMAINLKDIERELVNREHEIQTALEDIETKGMPDLTQALYRVREAIAHVRKAQEKQV